MKKELDTTKLYYGFPIIMVGYKDSIFGYNVTTISSSYSLGDMIVIATIDGTNLAENIKKYREFTINLPNEDIMYQMEGSGFESCFDKLKKLNIDYEIAKTIDAPIIIKCPINIECIVEDIIVRGGYVNIVSKVNRRIVSEELLNEDLSFNNEKFAPILFIGDKNLRSYRYLKKGKNNLGEFYK